jgi:N-acyl-D-aspartate/D-glutamate deacylase
MTRAHEFDLLIRGGRVVDGTGEPATTHDVAVKDGIVAEVGNLKRASADETVDADGLLVTPGFVDVHTHYDGQMTWDPLLIPSFHHGVTSIVAGNCGVGFAPVRPDTEKWLCGLMEGVEDIPGTALIAGIPWGWETYPEYLDAVAHLPHAIDVGALVPHGTVRAYVMGERGARNEAPTGDDIIQMAAIVREALAAGALGFSTSRTIVHKAIDGENVPGTFAGEDEILGITQALRDVGHGIVGWAPAGILGEDLDAPEREIALMKRVSTEMGCSVTFAINQLDKVPDQWKEILSLAEKANADGASLLPQVTSRPTAIHVGWRTVHPFLRHPTYLALAHLPFPERMERLRDPVVKAQILSEQPASPDLMTSHRTYPPAKLFRFTDPPNYEPERSRSIQSIADRIGVSPLSALYDVMLERDGEELVFYAISNYTAGDAEVNRVLLEHPSSLLGLSDGGAHVRVILDASQTTYMLTHWGRDRSRGPKLPLEWIVRKQTAGTAHAFGLRDRGLLKPGMKADLNLIDYSKLRLGVPHVVADLPGGAERLMQQAEGYIATYVSGVAVRRDGEQTGERPGRLIRGPQAPAFSS